MPFHPRWLAFLYTGGGPNWRYMEFITAALNYAADHALGVTRNARNEKTVTDHDKFTLACWIYATKP